MNVKLYIRLAIIALPFFMAGCGAVSGDNAESISGIYPHLAFYSSEGKCGTGAVVPWNGDLWVITYGPHKPYGSSDRLYQITPDMKVTARKESVGGTHANRMIHKESGQLNIGPYFIDKESDVRVIPWQEAPGRYTGTARHLTDPENKLYIATMEEGFYEVDVNTLEVSELYKDGNVKRKLSQSEPENGHLYGNLLPGAHGKGVYSGQGVLVYSNNGENTPEARKFFDAESGSLSEWDGRQWKVIRRNQFTEITGPGGIYGNPKPETDPIWATGWDHKSVLLGVREPLKGWSFYRLPKASHTYDVAHGWNTGWPRIRNVGTESSPDYLMTMHGLFWHFPETFTASYSAGIRPRSTYLKMIGDYARWNDRLVFGCDDAARRETMNRRKVNGDIKGPGQSNSNLWFTSLTMPDELGPATADGAVWSKEEVLAGEYSDPFLFAGWNKRMAWVANHGKHPVVFVFETDRKGNNEWRVLNSLKVGAGESMSVTFADKDRGEWIRVKTDRNTAATVAFTYTSDDPRSVRSSDMFAGLAPVDGESMTGGLLYGLGDHRKALGVLACRETDGKMEETGYYELDGRLNLVRKEDDMNAGFIRAKCAVPHQVVNVDKGSVLIVDGSGRRWRLPLGNEAYRPLMEKARLRICREVVTARDLFSCMGTFYELPAESADGYAKIRPVSSHNFRIHDYVSYRGMLVMTGIKPETGKGNEHVIVSDDGKAAVWAGVIDDLWQLGKPVGHGGPWKDSQVKAGVPSDPYLIGFYDRKELTLSHDSEHDVTFKVEVDPTGNGDWMQYMVQKVNVGQKWRYTFPEDFQARWIRFSADTDAVATAWLEYR